MSKQPYDVIVFGATSFVGQILCQYLMDRFGLEGDLKWAAAGRSQTKLDALKAALKGNAQALPTLVADAADAQALGKLCEQTRVVISTVGPYALYGEPLVKVCAETGTHYCDLTGEVQWIKRMLDRYESAAKASGARIVHCCGFDSIPSDMGVYFLQQQAKQRFAAPCPRVKMRVKAAKGEFSGGTAASLMNVTKEAVASPELRRELADPYSICPSNYPNLAKQPEVNMATHDEDFNSWMAPFIMSGINTRVVQRSNALADQAYGENFQYDEAMLTGSGAKGMLAAYGIALGMGGFLVAAALKPSRWALEKFVLPAPGEGPSPTVQENGYFDLRFMGCTAKGEKIRVKVTGDRDPGYGSTAKMLGEAGVCLAKDLVNSKQPGGFWTPATLMGELLVERLQAHAGLTFEVLE